MQRSTRIEPANEDDRRRALALEAEVYAADHGHVPPVEEHATYFVAKDENGDVVASFRVLGPSHRPFDLEQHADLGFLGAARQVALIGRLCVRSDFRSAGRQATLLVEMLRVAHRHCRAEGYSDVVMYTIPRLHRFYERACFRRTGLSYRHPVFDVEVEVMHLDLDDLDARLGAGDKRATVIYGRGTS